MCKASVPSIALPSNCDLPFRLRFYTYCFLSPPFTCYCAQERMVANQAAEFSKVLLTWRDEFRHHRNIFSHWNPNSEVIKRYTRRKRTRNPAQVLTKVPASENPRSITRQHEHNKHLIRYLSKAYQGFGQSPVFGSHWANT